MEEVRQGLELSPSEEAQGSAGSDLHCGRTPAVVSMVCYDMHSELVFFAVAPLFVSLLFSFSATLISQPAIPRLYGMSEALRHFFSLFYALNEFA